MQLGTELQVIEDFGGGSSRKHKLLYVLSAKTKRMIVHCLNKEASERVGSLMMSETVRPFLQNVEWSATTNHMPGKRL